MRRLFVFSLFSACQRSGRVDYKIKFKSRSCSRRSLLCSLRFLCLKYLQGMLFISWRTKEANVILQAHVCHLLISSQKVNVTHMSKQYAAGHIFPNALQMRSCIVSLAYAFVLLHFPL